MNLPVSNHMTNYGPLDKSTTPPIITTHRYIYEALPDQKSGGLRYQVVTQRVQYITIDELPQATSGAITNSPGSPL